MTNICFIATISMTLKIFIADTAMHLLENIDYYIAFIRNNAPVLARSLPEYIHHIPIAMNYDVNLSDFGSNTVFREVFQEQKCIKIAITNEFTERAFVSKAVSRLSRLTARQGACK